MKLRRKVGGVPLIARPRQSNPDKGMGGEEDFPERGGRAPGHGYWSVSVPVRIQDPGPVTPYVRTRG